jgi:hypothetical protein
MIFRSIRIIQSFFRTDIVNQCKQIFHAAEGAQSDSEEGSSIEYYRNVSDEETRESLCPTIATA